MSKVTVIIPAYEADENSSRSIESVSRQSHRDWELILAHDINDSNWNNILLKYNDTRIREVCGATLSESINKAINESTGEYITLLHVGDAMHSDRLRIQIKRMLHNKGTTICATWIRPLSNDIMNLFRCELEGSINNPIRMLLKNNFVYRSAAMVKKSFLIEHGISFEGKYLSNGEYALWFDILRHGGSIYIEPQYLTYTDTENKKGQQQYTMGEANEFLCIRRKILDYIIENIDNESTKVVWSDIIRSFDKAVQAGIIHNKMMLDIMHMIFHK